jgi:23S rRNA (cytidine1920-2'-O)/16S rRNA (cytidine1409-2'-O)-methyltransferase
MQSVGFEKLYHWIVEDKPNQPPGTYTEANHPFASRGGLKLDAALAASGIDVAGMACADLGCSTGGFVSCLLHRGAKQVYAVDTGYGVLDYGLRTDERVVVMERSNALHTDPPAEVASATGSETGSEALNRVNPAAEAASAKDSGLDLVTIDMGWTKQDKALAAALKWLKPAGRVITLIKPHYEQPRDTPTRKGKKAPKPEPLTLDESHAITQRVLDAIGADESLGLSVLGWCDSPIRGAKGGNLEQLAWLQRQT